MNEPAVEILDAIATANERFGKLASDLRNRPAVKEVQQAVLLNTFRPPATIMLDMYVDAELAHGPGLAWSIGAWWHPDWGVEGAVQFVYGEDSEDVCRFPGRRTTDAHSFVGELRRVVDSLMATVSTLDLASFESRFPASDQG